MKLPSAKIVRCESIYKHHSSILDLSVVELPQIGQKLRVPSGDEVDSDSLSSEAARTADSVDVLGGVSGKVVVDDEVDLLDIDASAQQISGDQDS